MLLLKTANRDPILSLSEYCPHSFSRAVMSERIRSPGIGGNVLCIISPGQNAVPSLESGTLLPFTTHVEARATPALQLPVTDGQPSVRVRFIFPAKAPRGSKNKRRSKPTGNARNGGRRRFAEGK